MSEFACPVPDDDEALKGKVIEAIVLWAKNFSEESSGGEYEFEEFHYKMIVSSADKANAIQIAKQSAFFKHTHFEGAPSHVDDKYGVDVDDLYDIQEILAKQYKQKYQLHFKPSTSIYKDELHIGYLKIDKITSTM